MNRLVKLNSIVEYLSSFLAQKEVIEYSLSNRLIHIDLKKEIEHRYFLHHFYDGYGNHSYFNDEEQQEIYQKVVEKIITFPVQQVNLSFFRPLLQCPVRREEIRRRLSGHPSLQVLYIAHPSSTTRYEHPPTSLYRHKDGTFYWAHFRNNNL